MIYTAVYSSIPVYEMMCRGIAVMKRRSDHCLNATQILKVAGIEKGRRTKILEREVLTGEHEKVQGGYGKYQGTWVPFQRGVELAQQYGVEAYLRPLFDYQPSQDDGSIDKTPTKEQAMSVLHRNKGTVPSQYTMSPSASIISTRSSGGGSTSNRSQEKKALSSSANTTTGYTAKSHHRQSTSSSVTSNPNINIVNRPASFLPLRTTSTTTASSASASSIARQRQPSFIYSNANTLDTSSELRSLPYHSNNSNNNNSNNSNNVNSSADTAFRLKRRNNSMTIDHDDNMETADQSNSHIHSLSTDETLLSSPSNSGNNHLYYSTAGSPRTVRPSFPPLSPVPFTPTITLGANSTLANTRINDHEHSDELTSDELTASQQEAALANKDEQRIALMSIFLSDDPNHMPEVLLNEDSLNVLDVNIVIDDQGHSALHWAASLARLQVVRLLLARGADVMRVNYAGESALIRAVLVTNNYERDTFPQLLRLLGASVLLRDSRNRTVFHHIALHAGIKGRVMAARYYMSCLLSYLIEEEDSIIGEEARVGCRMMMEQLIEAGARRDLHNKYDLGPDDFGVIGNMDTVLTNKPLDNDDHTDRSRNDPRTRTTAGDARSRELLAVVERLVTDMDNDFDTELRIKKEQLLEAQQRVREASHELAKVRGKAHQVRARGRYLSQLKVRVNTLTAQLKEREEKGEKIQITNEEHTREHLSTLPLAELRLQLEVYEARDVVLKEQIQQLSTRDRAAEKESRYRRLIAACSRVPLTMVDQQLDTLTTAVESDGDALDLERVEDFLRNLPTSIRSPFHNNPSNGNKECTPVDEPAYHLSSQGTDTIMDIAGTQDSIVTKTELDMSDHDSITDEDLSIPLEVS
ncbi:hypothetical protein BDF22DRAFT_772570 [Syncephalis plumigaleata]|nr:hypothetical protein BDF22DRAFT_772570 [Syncephalis plumigaleata]